MQQGVALHQSGRLAEAERIYQQVLQQDPRDADALQLLGLIHHQSGRHESAVELLSRAIKIRPHGVFFVNLSQAQRAVGRLEAALDSCRRAVQMEPRLAEAWNNLGTVLRELGRYDESLVAQRKAVELNPRYVHGWNNLGNSLAACGFADQAESALRRATELDPRYAPAYSNLANVLTKLGRLDEAVDLSRRAATLDPKLAEAWSNLGVALHSQGYFDEGNEAFLRAAAIDPANPRTLENHLGSFSYTSRLAPQQVFDAHVDWAKNFADPLAPSPPVHIAQRSGSKLRIGYVSPDFVRHSVAYFFEPLLEHHDRSHLEITLYANVERPDDVTKRLQSKCDCWRDIVRVSDDDAVAMIRADEIDVLVDLAGHTVGNRLLVFARKPAPVQVTYLGYPETTGLSEIDWRITDELADPPGVTERFHSEKLWRVPAPFVRYRPPEQGPAVVDAPASGNGYVTFGSFNKAAKANAETIMLWAKVLIAMPTARLIMKSQGLRSTGSRRRILDGFAAHGVDPARIELIEAEQPLAEHLEMYGRIDIALDTFPYHGTTTTCEALWMGVPVVSLSGVKHVSRVGLSLLSAVGHAEWATATEGAFVTKAVELASLAARQRHQLRSEVMSSPLCDAAELAKSLEAAYRQMFAEKEETGLEGR